MMKPEDIKVKMDAAYDRYQKRLATTKKFEARRDKNFELIKKNGWDKYMDEKGNINPYEVRKITNNDKAFDIIYAWEDAARGAEESAKKEPEELEKYEGWVKKYNDALKFAKSADEMPEIFKEVVDLLAKEWTDWDIQDRERMKKMKAELPPYKYGMTEEERNKYRWAHKAYQAAFPGSRESFLKQSDDYIYDKNKDTATAYVQDLIHRIKNKVGEITDLRNVRFVGKALNGVVEGTMGKVSLETILAGGYNVQRLHYRVILHNAK